MSDLKTEYFAALLASQEIHDRITEGTRLLVIGGPEGIQEVAQTNPESVLSAIEALSTLYSTLWKEHLALIEQYFSVIDIIESAK